MRPPSVHIHTAPHENCSSDCSPKLSDERLACVLFEISSSFLLFSFVFARAISLLFGPAPMYTFTFTKSILSFYLLSIPTVYLSYFWFQSSARLHCRHTSKKQLPAFNKFYLAVFFQSLQFESSRYFKLARDLCGENVHRERKCTPLAQRKWSFYGAKSFSARILMAFGFQMDSNDLK